jgi:hypothetical protein
VHRVCERFDEKRLGEAGHAFEQTMAACGESDEELLNDGLLSDDAPAKGGFEFLEIGDEGGGGGGVGHEKRKGRMTKAK